MEKSGQSSLLIILVLAIAVIGGYLLFVRKSPTSATPSPTPFDESESLNPSPNLGGSMEAASPAATVAVKEFQLTGNNYRFSQSSLTVKQGDTVKITLTSGDMPHDFTIDEFGVKSDTVNKGESTTFQFVADKAGTYQYYCSVDGHRAKGMVGTLTVTQ